MFTGRFTLFCNLLKIVIEILGFFVYNVFIVMHGIAWERVEGKSLPERSLIYHVHSQFHSQHLLAGP